MLNFIHLWYDILLFVIYVNAKISAENDKAFQIENVTKF